MTTQVVNRIGRKLQLALVSTVLASSLAVAVPALSAGATSTPGCEAFDLTGVTDGVADGVPDGHVGLVDIYAIITRDRTNGSSIITVLNDVMAAASHFGACPKQA